MNPWATMNGVASGVGAVRWALQCCSLSSSSTLSTLGGGGGSSISISSISSISLSMRRQRAATPRRMAAAAAGRRETPYEVLGVGPSASARDIKRAYRRLALRFHPDVNKEPDAQERFMRIKHAYNTLINSSSASASSSSRSRSPPQPPPQEEGEDPFYGLADFLRDLQQEFRNWEADLDPQDQPKSLWEELAAIGEEFVEFLEKELNVKENDVYAGDDPMGSQKEQRQEDDAQRQPSVEESIDEVEAALTQLKKELGL